MTARPQPDRGGSTIMCSWSERSSSRAGDVTVTGCAWRKRLGTPRAWKAWRRHWRREHA
jgi:hypothetical protein